MMVTPGRYSSIVVRANREAEVSTAVLPEGAQASDDTVTTQFDLDDLTAFPELPPLTGRAARIRKAATNVRIVQVSPVTRRIVRAWATWTSAMTDLRLTWTAYRHLSPRHEGRLYNLDGRLVRREPTPEVDSVTGTPVPPEPGDESDLTLGPTMNATFFRTQTPGPRMTLSGRDRAYRPVRCLQLGLEVARWPSASAAALSLIHI